MLFSKLGLKMQKKTRKFKTFLCEAREKRIFFLNEQIGNSCRDSIGKTLEISLDLGLRNRSRR